MLRHLGNPGYSSTASYPAVGILLGLGQGITYVPREVFEYLVVLLGEGMEPFGTESIARGGKVTRSEALRVITWHFLVLALGFLSATVV